MDAGVFVKAQLLLSEIKSSLDRTCSSLPSRQLSGTFHTSEAEMRQDENVPPSRWQQMRNGAHSSPTAGHLAALVGTESRSPKVLDPGPNSQMLNSTHDWSCSHLKGTDKVAKRKLFNSGAHSEEQTLASLKSHSVELDAVNEQIRKSQILKPQMQSGRSTRMGGPQPVCKLETAENRKEPQASDSAAAWLKSALLQDPKPSSHLQKAPCFSASSPSTRLPLFPSSHVNTLDQEAQLLLDRVKGLTMNPKQLASASLFPAPMRHSAGSRGARTTKTEISNQSSTKRLGVGSRMQGTLSQSTVATRHELQCGDLLSEIELQTTMSQLLQGLDTRDEYDSVDTSHMEHGEQQQDVVAPGDSNATEVQPSSGQPLDGDTQMEIGTEQKNHVGTEQKEHVLEPGSALSDGLIHVSRHGRQQQQRKDRTSTAGGIQDNITRGKEVDAHRQQLACKFHAMYTLYKVMSTWLVLSRDGAPKRLMERTMRLRQEAAEKEEALKLEVARRFRRLYILHCSFTSWRQQSSAEVLKPRDSGQSPSSSVTGTSTHVGDENNQELSHKMLLASKFRRLYTLHHVVSEWAWLSRASRDKRQQTHEQQQRQMKIAGFLAKVSEGKVLPERVQAQSEGPPSPTGAVVLAQGQSGPPHPGPPPHNLSHDEQHQQQQPRKQARGSPALATAKRAEARKKQIIAGTAAAGVTATAASASEMQKIPRDHMKQNLIFQREQQPIRRYESIEPQQLRNHHTQPGIFCSSPSISAASSPTGDQISASGDQITLHVVHRPSAKNTSQDLFSSSEGCCSSKLLQVDDSDAADLSDLTQAAAKSTMAALSPKGLEPLGSSSHNFNLSAGSLAMAQSISSRARRLTTGAIVEEIQQEPIDNSMSRSCVAVAVSVKTAPRRVTTGSTKTIMARKTQGSSHIAPQCSKFQTNFDFENAIVRAKGEEMLRRRKTAEQLVAAQDALLQEAMALSQLHYQRSLLIRFGLRPWHAFLVAAREADLLAVRHRIRHYKICGLHGLVKAVAQSRWKGVVAHAVALSGMRMLRQARLLRSVFRIMLLWTTTGRVARERAAQRVLHSLKMAVHHAREQEYWVLMQWRCNWLIRILVSWREVTAAEGNKRLLEKLQNEYNEEQAYSSVILSYCFKRWSSWCQDWKSERQQRMKRHMTLKKIDSWLIELKQKRGQSESVESTLFDIGVLKDDL